jgi:hypothetical protein
MMPDVDFGSTPTLYICNGILDGAARWVKMPTYGQKPPYGTMVYAFDESANSIVGWAGSYAWTTDGVIPPYTGATIRQFYVLPLHSMIWRYGPGLLNGDLAANLPPSAVGSYNGMVYDPIGQRTILNVGGQSGTGVRFWSLKLAGPAV